jgi:hypothetical protein
VVENSRTNIIGRGPQNKNGEFLHVYLGTEIIHP